MTTESHEVQAQNLAELFAGVADGAFIQVARVMIKGGECKFERIDAASFTMTTPSGTVLRCRVDVLKD